jgi:hypothetical protein
MRIEVIDNEFATMGRELKKAFATASAANCATAFLTPAGTRFLRNVLTDAQRQKQDLHIRLIVGLYLETASECR